MKKVDILAVGAHPDDVELACSGTLLAQRERGSEIGLLDLTLGELGTRGTPEIRSREARDAAQRLGASFRTQLDLGDGFFPEDEASLRAIIRVIRASRPDVLLANALRDRHPDHARGAQLTARAAFLSGLRRIETVDEEGRPQEAWRPDAVYHYIQDFYQEPDFVVDISEHMVGKLALIKTFRSQFYDPQSTEPESPISGEDFLSFIEARARDMGRPAGYTYAEGFVSARRFGVKDLFVLD